MFLDAPLYPKCYNFVTICCCCCAAVADGGGAAVAGGVVVVWWCGGVVVWWAYLPFGILDLVRTIFFKFVGL